MKASGDHWLDNGLKKKMFRYGFFKEHSPSIKTYQTELKRANQEKDFSQ